MTQDEMAAALGISIDTLQKYFAAELYQAACARRMDMLDAQYRAGIRGNVAAQRAYLAHGGPIVVAPPAREGDGDGKKAKAARDAKTAGEGTPWGNLLAFPGGKAAS